MPLSLLCERPLVGVEIEVFVPAAPRRSPSFDVLGLGATPFSTPALTATQQPEPEPEPEPEREVRWYRLPHPSPRRPPAACAACGATPAVLEAAALRSHPLLRGVGGFCSGACLRAHWPQLRDLQAWAQAQASTRGGLTAETGGEDGLAAEAAGGAREAEPEPEPEALILDGRGGRVLLGSGPRYVPTTDDIGAVLEVCWGDETLRTAAVLPLPPPAPPAQRPLVAVADPWEPAALRPRHRSPLLLSVASYNVLAELYSSPHTYSYCPPCYSGWHYRKRNVVRELLSLPAEQHPGHAGPQRSGDARQQRGMALESEGERRQELEEEGWGAMDSPGSPLRPDAFSSAAGGGAGGGGEGGLVEGAAGQWWEGGWDPPPPPPGEPQGRGPDVICMQEVQADHFERWWRPEMARHGYAGVFAAKSKESMGGVGKMDGCAVFWRTAALRKRRAEVVRYDDVARTSVPPDDATNSRSLRRLLKGNIAQLVELEWRRPDPEHPESAGRRAVLVCNTHLISERTVPDVKLFQAQALLQAVARHQQQAAEGGGAPAEAVIIAGDFNSLPGSAVHELLTTGALRPEAAEATAAAHDDAVTIPEEALQHGLELRSAYPSAKEIRERDGRAAAAATASAVLAAEPVGEDRPQNARGMVGTDRLPADDLVAANGGAVFTNFTSGFVGCLDYLLYSHKSLRRNTVLRLPSARVLSASTALPSAQRSSDHLMLMATFELLPCQEPPTEYTPPQAAATLAELSVGADFSFRGGFSAASAEGSGAAAFGGGQWSAGAAESYGGYAEYGGAEGGGYDASLGGDGWGA